MTAVKDGEAVVFFFKCGVLEVEVMVQVYGEEEVRLYRLEGVSRI